LVMAGGLILLWRIWVGGGFVWFGRKVGLFLPAPDRLKQIVSENSSRMNIPVRELLLMRVSIAQAFAFPNRRKLLFTERILELLSDEELSTVCSHELGHLTESRGVRYARSARTLGFLPWLFFNPLVHTMGPAAIFCLYPLTILVPYLSRRVGLKMEARADQIAKANEGDPGTYARALSRIYEDNLMPAVIARKRRTHPDLYDRIVAAGVTPDFPKPVPAASMGAHGAVFSGLMGILFAVFLVRQLGAFEPDQYGMPFSG
jgi:Zn-dependent protease with chaperone function